MNPFTGAMRLCWGCLVLVLAASLVGCELVPNKPDAVFILYRDRMKADSVAEARNLISDESRELTQRIAADFNLKQPPENMAVLNVLDPVAAPVIVTSEDTKALLQIRTLKGGTRPIQLLRKDPNSPWKVDLVDDLTSLRIFLEARDALDMIREQAGEYAASLRAFNEQMERMDVTEPPPVVSKPPQPKAQPPKQVKKPRPRADPKKNKKPQSEQQEDR